MSLIEAFTTRQLRILDTLIPNPHQLSPENLRRARLLVGILFYAFTLNILLIAVRYQNTGWSTATINALFSQFIYLGLLLTYKLSKNLNLISDAAIALALVSISITIYADGGLTSRATYWLSVFPLVSQSIAYRMKAVVTVSLIISLLFSTYLLHGEGILHQAENQQVLFARALTLTMATLFVAIVSVIYDKGRKALEKQLTIEKENAEQAFKLKSEFLATMSHELRTPFNGVLGMLELLSNSQLSDQQQHRVHLAKSSAQSLLMLINDILDFSKIEAGKQDIEAIDFDAQMLFGDIAEAMAYQASSKNIEIVLDTHQLQQPSFKGDPNRIRQITTNLISNAIKFTKVGTVLVTVESQPDANGSTLQVSVQDSGIGIPKEKLDILFQSFTQVDASTSRKYGGSGLGLAIAKRLCQLMGGDIQVTSKEGIGSTFSFTVSLDNPDHATDDHAPEKIAGNIVIVDDNPISLSTIKNQLSADCHHITALTQADEALTHLTNNPDNALIFIDMNMPTTNGIELIKAIQNNQTPIKGKLILMSDISNLDGNTLLQEMGVSLNIPKPITHKDLKKALALTQTSLLKNTEQPANKPDQIPTDLTLYKSEIHILVVDDNPINLEVAAALLDSFDIQPVLASSAHEAFKILSSHPKKDFIHGIIMDCQMPTMDGFEATQAIRNGLAGNSYINIPIIALTANAMKGDKERCLAAGMNDYLTKPINIDKLVTVIHSIVIPGIEPKH